MDGDAGFAGVYDAIYADPVFLAAQLAFLESAFSGIPGPLLDAGCGTGRHLVPLSKRGYHVVGVDISPAMLSVARASLTEAGLAGDLVRGDLRLLPFGSVFGGILCLDSPLALILTDDDLAATLAALHRSLRPDSVLVAEVFDYVGTLGAEPIAPWTGSFPAPTWANRHSGVAPLRPGGWHLGDDAGVLRAAGRSERVFRRHPSAAHAIGRCVCRGARGRGLSRGRAVGVLSQHARRVVI